MRGTAEFGQFGFQFRHFRTEHKLAMLQHRIQPAAQLVLDPGLLRLEV